jgi:NAD(P)-dependent dehydrogenase (short-subunit alcohol dehydrogenase family)
MSGALYGKVALVTGASRGIGKGVALALAEEGATIYVTGRTAQEGTAVLPGTIGETAALVEARGGRAVAVQVDHADDRQIAALFKQIFSEQGRLNLLVNNAIALPSEMTWNAGFWEKPLSNWQIFDIGVRAAFIAAREAAHIMVPQKSGLIVTLSGYVRNRQGGNRQDGARYGNRTQAA